MTELTIPTIKKETFGLEAVPGVAPRFRFWGNGDTSAISALDMFLRQVHDQMENIDENSIEVDLGELYIMNSSCMKQFISWIYKVDTGGSPYTICFWVTPRLRWQSRTVATFKRLAPGTVEVRQLQSIPPPKVAS